MFVGRTVLNNVGYYAQVHAPYASNNTVITKNL